MVRNTSMYERGWDIAVRLVPLLAVLLPAIGVGIRWINFAFDPSIPSQVVLAASVPELAQTGFRAVLSMVPAILLGGWTFAAERGRRSVEAPAPVEVPRRISGVLAVIALIFVTLFAPAFVIGAVGGLLAGMTLGRSAQVPTVRFIDVLPAVVILAISTAFQAGVTPTTTRAAFVRFDTLAPLPDGWYLPLGSTEQGWYLRACNGDRRVALVDRAAVAVMMFSEHVSVVPSATLIDAARGSAIPVGFNSTCAE